MAYYVGGVGFKHDVIHQRPSTRKLAWSGLSSVVDGEQKFKCLPKRMAMAVWFITADQMPSFETEILF